MNPYSYAISLRIEHPSIDPAVIGERLGLAASHSWRAGEPRTNLRGAPLGGTRDSSYWTARLIDSSDAEATLAVALARLARDLCRHGEMFRRLRGEGGRAELFIGWFLEGNTGDELPAELLSELGSLGLDLSLDVYPSDAGAREARAGSGTQ